MNKIPAVRFLAAMIRRALQKKAVRYLIVGGSVYLFELWVIIVAQHRGATPTEAVALSFTLGLIVSFFLQKLVTFGDKRMHHKIVLRQALAVGLLVLWNLGFTVLLTRLLEDLIPPTITRTIALLITTIWNFYLYKTRIFTPSPVKSVAVERPSLLLGVHRAAPLRLPDPLPSPEKASHDQKLTSLIIVGICLGIIAALVAAATLMQSATNSSRGKTAAASAQTINDTACARETILQIVAHEDDDLLFMSPDLQKAIDAGKCVRTVYMTAGNAGAGLEYAKLREKGAKAAYSTMLRLPANDWLRQYLRLDSVPSVELAVPAANTRVSLLFYRLPDGGIDGGGYAAEGEPPRSLAGLLDGAKSTLTTVDARGVYTQEMLVRSLSQLIARYKPAEIRTLGALPDERAADHSDHYATGWIARQALAAYRADHPEATMSISFYMGYPVMYREKNLSPSDLAAKEAAFFAYAKFDDSVCQDFETCNSGENAYASYLPRMYTIPESDTYSWPN